MADFLPVFINTHLSYHISGEKQSTHPKYGRMLATFLTNINLSC